MPPIRRADSRAHQHGLTLVELLVAMLIMGFVLALVSQAVFQVSQVTRSAQNATAELTGRWAAGWTVGPVLANLVVPAEAPIGKAFESTADRLSGYTTLPIDGTQTGVKAFQFQLVSVSDGASASTAMRASSSGPTAGPAEPVTVATFAGRAEFAYLDAAGQFQSQWPPVTVSATQETDDLPRAVVVRRPFGGEVLMWYPFQGDVRRPLPPSLPFGLNS